MLAVNTVRFDAPHRLLSIALAFGVIADALLRATPWGLNVLLTLLCALGAAVALTRWSGIELSGEGRWLAAPIVVFGVGLVWRDSPTLTIANAAALLLSITLAALTARSGQLRLAGVSQYLVGALYMFLFALAGLLPTLTREVSWRGAARARWTGGAVAATRGLALAIPPVIVFGFLLAAADANYERLL